MDEYTPKLYPSWRYHRDGRARIIETPEEHEALHAEGWRDTPAAFAPEVASEIAPDRKAKRKK